MDLCVLEGEELLPVVKAVEVATKRRPNKGSSYRWMGTGVRHIRLPYLMYGGQRVTSVEAVRRWMDAVTAACRRDIPQSRSIFQREDDIVRAEQKLTDSGW